MGSFHLKCVSSIFRIIRKRQWQMYVIGFILCFWIISHNPRMHHWKSRDKFVVQYPSNTSLKSSVIKVGFWTGFFGNMNGWEEFYGSLDKSHCDVTCDFIFSKSEIRTKYNEMHALIFNARDLYAFNELPLGRRLSQHWILHNTEPPWWTWLEMQKYNGVFNLTSFVRRDSDIPTYYGKVVKKRNKTFFIQDYFKEKTKFAAWMAGNCITQNGREDAIKELSKYISIDTFGKCGKLHCPKHSIECKHKIISHKFYFAFENGNCRDYVTEKLWRSLKFNVIPVVMGDSSVYRDVAPPNSYIDANEFKSPADLARHLVLIASNKTLYNGYFQWKLNYDLEKRNGYWCELFLHNFKGKGQIYTDMDGWFRQDTCSPWNVIDKVFLELRKTKNDIEKYLGLR